MKFTTVLLILMACGFLLCELRPCGWLGKALNELAGRRCAAAMVAGNERLVDFWNWVEVKTRD